jgi:leucyl aminopeptidase
MSVSGAYSITSATGPVLAAKVDVLAFVTFGDPTKDAVFKFVDSQLRGALAEVAKAELFEGKSGQLVSLYSAHAIAAKRVVVIGGGPRADFTNPHIRDITAALAQHANKVGAGSVAFVLPALGANREALLIQMATEGLYLGTYKFARYLTSE